MIVFEFLAYLSGLDVDVFVEDNCLRWEAKKGVLSAELSGEIAAREGEIIAFLQGIHRSNDLDFNGLLRRGVRGNIPLSFAQQRLWFLDQLVGNNPFYNMPAAVRLTGNLNLVVLEKAFNEIVRRHEVLRTSFAVVGEEPVQKITADFSLRIQIADMRKLPLLQREIEAQKITNQEAEKTFDLITGPLLRVLLIQLEESEYLLMLNMHHIVSDGWSIGVLIHELSSLYTAFTQETLSPLPELPIQYADFACWQREFLQGEVLENQLSYWRQQLDGISALNLPIDRPIPAVQSYRGCRKFLQFPKQLSQDLETLSQQRKVTLFMTLLAAFKILFYRYTQQEDIAIGSPVANRNRIEIEPLIGFFVNSLVLRTDLSGNPTFLELLQRVKQTALGAYAHQDLPFEKLVEELHPERHLNQNPLFQVVFALQNAPMKALELPGITLSPQQLNVGTTRFDLEFHLWESTPHNNLWVEDGGGISGFVIYSTDLFDETTITRMLDHFQILLEGIVKNPEQRLSELPVLSKKEQHQILIEWNQTQADFPKNLCVHQLFEIQAKQRPDALALVFGEEKITYKELNQRSNQLAHILQKKGVTAESLVGLFVGRCVDLIVGMLGILKAGGAYLILDPIYPSERLNFMLEDAQISLLLTHKHEQKHWKKPNLEIIYLDKIYINAEKIYDNIAVDVAINNLVYVIYTSGSTGTPKGVEIEHHSLLNLIFWHQKQFSVSPNHRATQIAGIAFDACVWEIWPYLIAGATLYFPDDETRLSPEKLRDWLIEKQITISFLPTPLAEKILQLQWPVNTALRILLTGGEKLHQYPLASHPFKLVNNYGPTENTVVTTSAVIPVRNNTEISPTIGRPIANTCVYVLDKHLQPVPVGIPGELYISGEGVARGYRHRPELTTERFIWLSKNNIIPPTRLYKTGDLVRYLHDGNLEFLGRTDEQVKIRGFRIELGEIETILTQHPAVQKCVVIAAENVQQDKHLIAYIALNSEVTNPPEKQLQNEHISQWQILYNETYQQPATDSNPDFNIIGWNSSYTGQPLPSEQLQEWVNNQVAQILALQPNKVLEIGCGTGLLLFRIAPHCTAYYGTDFSLPSLNYIQQHLQEQNLNHVTLLQQMATDFNQIENGTFDTIILNSIVQYFPSIDYLLEVIEKAIKSTVPGGFIFIGDVRNLQTLEAFHTAVQLYRAEASLSCKQLQQRVQMQIFQESELVIDPDFFGALKQHFPQIIAVKIELLRGSFQNELTQFRYNVILQIGGEIETCKNMELLSFQPALTVSEVRHFLLKKQPECLRVAGVPNARVRTAIKAAEWLQTEKFKTAGQLQNAVQKLQNSGIDPQEWWDLEIPYIVNINPAEKDTYDVTFIRGDALKIFPEENAKKMRPWHTYSNNPLQAKAARQVVPQLQTYLAEKLPEYMIPAAFVILQSFPLTANGKIDRRALITPDLINIEVAGNYAAPQTEIEQILAKIWTEILGLKRVGVRDNFFELGGHSLLATQLVSRVRDTLGIELPLRQVFEAPNIAELAKIIGNIKQSSTQTKTPALVPLSRESRRIKLSSLNKENQGK
ncbi:MAG TPA: amino acid adenylation domain-containing protein [Halomicronema sp.]